MQMLTKDELEQIKAIAETLYKGGMAPRGCDTVHHVAARIIAGREIGLNAVQSIKGIMVTNGITSIWGDAALAMVIASRQILSIDEGSDKKGGWCKIHRKDFEPRSFFFTWEQAQKAGLVGKKGPWSEYPERMIMMRARAYALRDTCPDLLMGLSIVEEVQDYADEKPEPVIAQTPAANDVPAMPGPPATQTWEHDPHKLNSLKEFIPTYFERIAWGGTWKEYLDSVYPGVDTVAKLNPEQFERLYLSIGNVEHQARLKEVFPAGDAQFSESPQVQ